MATSRTGTRDWKLRRTKALKEAQANGITHCKHCNVELNYHKGLQPNSAEVDHIKAWSHTRTNTGPLQVICRHCNQSKGNRDKPKNTNPANHYVKLKTSRNW